MRGEYWQRMGRSCLWGALAVSLLAACSTGGDSAAPTTTTTTSTTSTTVPTTPTTSAEDAVKQAYLDYWAMIDRLGAAPDPDDPELRSRAVDPVLSAVREDMSTRRAQGRTTRIPPNSKYVHRIQSVAVDGTTASVVDCFLDDRVQFASDGAVLNDNVSTTRSTGRLLLRDQAWLVSSVQNEKLGDGEVPCGP